MLPILVFLGSKLMEAMPVIFLGKMAISPFWSAYKRSQQKFLPLLGRAQAHAAKKLAQALGELVVRGKNKGLDSHELYRNLEALLSRLCLDACHQRVADQVHAAIIGIARKQHRAMRRGKHEIGTDSAGQLRLLLLWDPECAEVFEATKVDAGTRDTAPALQKRKRRFEQLSWVEVAKVPGVADTQQEFRESVEGIFDRAKEMHETQRKLAEALLDYDGLLESSASDAAISSKRGEVEELRDKLRELSVPDRLDSRKNVLARGNVDDIANLSVVPADKPTQQWQWQKAGYSLLLLTNRFDVRRPLRRKREITELFNAVDATDAERDDIEERIRVIYKVIHKRWSQDGWIKQVARDVFPTRRSRKLPGLSRRTNRPSPFSNFLYRGWWKTKSKRRWLFLEHHSTFELKSPRQLTEEGVLGMVQTMEDQEDKIFVRESRLNRELQEIYDSVQENTRQGKFDAVIEGLNILVRRVSGRGKRKLYPPEMVSQICSYLAYMYAYRGEHLEEAVRLAQRAMRIHDTWLTRLAIGWCYHRQGKVRKAVKELEVAKSAASRAGSGLLPLVYLVLGDACRDAKWHRKAQQAWQAGLELASAPEWKEQPGLTCFEVTERADLQAGLQKALSEGLGMEEAAPKSKAKTASNTRAKRAKAAPKSKAKTASNTRAKRAKAAPKSKED